MSRKTSICPSDCAQSSGPVCRSWARMLPAPELIDAEGVAPRHDFRGLLLNSARSSPETWPSTAPSACATIMTSAPNASIWRTRSTELPREIKATKGCPRARQTTARPVPVLPLVSSTTVCPGRSSPEARASRMISRAILSFLLPPGLKYSSFTSSRPDKPRLSTLRVSSRSGVRPITSRMERARGGQLVFIRSRPGNLAAAACLSHHSSGMNCLDVVSYDRTSPVSITKTQP